MENAAQTQVEGRMPVTSDSRTCDECRHVAELRIYKKGSIAVFSKLPHSEQRLDHPEFPDAKNLCFNCSEEYEQKGYQVLTFGYTIDSSDIRPPFRP